MLNVGVHRCFADAIEELRTLNQQSAIKNQQSTSTFSMSPIPMNGLLIIDKPAGPTSHDVVARVRRALRTKRVGHTGTLDPLATGVLPLVVGSATRLASLLSGADKEYVATIRLGRATDTYDAAGLEGPPPDPPSGIDSAALDTALNQFRGTFHQMPPAFSAKKIGGVPAHKLARHKMPVQLAPVEVTVHRLALEGYADGVARVRVTTSAGFYVRSLAHDVGQRLGCGGYLERLRRVRVGTYAEESAVSLDEFEREGVAAGRRIIPMDRLLLELPAVVLNDQDVRRATHGNELVAENRTGAGTSGSVKYRLLDSSGRLIAIAETLPGGVLHPVTVLV
jgi:tRNA pseudouridine55 synthase